MNSKKKPKTWGDIVELKYGKSLKNYKECKEGYPVYGTNGPIGFTSKPLCPYPSIIIGRKGAYRGVHYSSEPFFVIDTAFFIEPKVDINLKWAYYNLLLVDINGMDSGSAIPSLSREDFYQIPVDLPSIETQNKIVQVLDSLENKIANNNRINQSLEEIAQALFKSWFVDFDPVKAKMEAKAQGKDPQLAAMMAISGKTTVETQGFASPEYDELRATADLFPDQLVESELGLIPEGWILKPLYETAEYVNGGAFKSKDFTESKEGLPIIKIAELKSGISAQTKYTSKEMPEKYRISNDDMLYSWSGSPETSLEVFKWYGGEGWLNQHIFKINTESIEQKVFVYYLLKYLKPQLIQIAKNKQTTGLGHVTVADMKRMQVVIPNDISFQLITDNFISLFEQASNCKKQNFILSQQRDTLLPRLLSGKIEV